MHTKRNPYLLSALLIGLVFHGSSMFFTLEYTYDALIHVFFSNHYITSWFDPWNYNWYNGFSVLGYPPLSHQIIALLSFIGGIKFGLFFLCIFSILLFLQGVYNFSLLLLRNRKVAGYATIFAVCSSSLIETIHIFGQIPTILGIAFLLHTLPHIYNWVLHKSKYSFFCAISLIGLGATAHHVTPIFGMVFFIIPTIGMAVMEHAKKSDATYEDIRFLDFIRSLREKMASILVFTISSILVIILSILPYWINIKNNPITQVPIPHGSRDDFLEVASSGLMFFLIPWGILLCIFPYIWYRYLSRRLLFFGISILILTLLGTGGTSVIPKLILGENAFNILTLDRFSFWGSVMAIPIAGEFFYRLFSGDIKIKIIQKFGLFLFRTICSSTILVYVSIAVLTISLGYFRPFQPQKIKMLPIVNFLNADQHYKWRYLTLGFGDQMAWLASLTKAKTIDGNYHSARRLPELTSRAIERLENSKFKGVEGIGSLQQFLTVPEKYHLKYIFSNDKFYDPILYFCGWQRLQVLENGIMVWEKLSVPPLPGVLPKEDVSLYQKIWWGILPMLILLIAFIVNIQYRWIQHIANKTKDIPISGIHIYKSNNQEIKRIAIIICVWLLFVAVSLGMYTFSIYQSNNTHLTPTNAVASYYDALDFKKFERAYEHLDPLSNKTLDQFLLEISVTDGLLSSYAKLDAMEPILIEQKNNKAKVMVTTHWITSLERFTKVYYHDLIKRNNKWYLILDDFDRDLPPEQLVIQNTSIYYNHGRRKVTSEQTYHEDILKQPILEILSATLIKSDGKFSIIGELQNIDNSPADVNVRGSIFNYKDKLLATYNAKYLIKHNLYPKEITSFKVDFEGIAGQMRTTRFQRHSIRKNSLQ
ncbi:hypothetical protein [Tenacibaculum sp. SG-28]|uniref:hypothetical protein n=1 Tax=Tenacibaculum sp. SG-28 TaxID=754426 RepID=UPI0026813675